MTAPHSPYVLLVDDDPDIRSTVELALELYGYDVVSVANGLEALDWLRGGHALPFLILLDFMMPEMSGSQFRSEQQQDPTLAAIPTVVLTGAGMLSDVSSDVLATEVLRKPIGLDALLSAVRRHSRLVD
jgi:two-component system response regulator MprA